MSDDAQATGPDMLGEQLREYQRRTQETLAGAYDRDWKAACTDPVPQAARVLLRVEYADGQVRELEVHHPHSFECKIEHPELPMPLTGDPLAMPAMGATSVRLRFKASRDARCGPGCPGGHYRHPIVLRHEAAREDEGCVTCGASSEHWVPQHRMAR